VSGVWSSIPIVPTADPAHTGDITLMNASVVDKSLDDKARAIVQVDFKMTNQLGTVMSTAKAEIQLPQK
jgi:hypothetical protein